MDPDYSPDDESDESYVEKVRYTMSDRDTRNEEIREHVMADLRRRVEGNRAGPSPQMYPPGRNGSNSQFSSQDNPSLMNQYVQGNDSPREPGFYHSGDLGGSGRDAMGQSAERLGEGGALEGDGSQFLTGVTLLEYLKRKRQIIYREVVQQSCFLSKLRDDLEALDYKLERETMKLEREAEVGWLWADGHEFPLQRSAASAPKFEDQDGDLDHEEYRSEFPRRMRIKWTPPLHDKFVKAAAAHGGPWKATPSKIIAEMDIPGLNLCHIKSHLQKYRLNLKASGVQEHQSLSNE